MPTATERIQGVTQATATGKPKVALDTCCVQYYINNPPVQPWADCLDPIFRAAVDGKIDLYVSTVVVSELLAHVYFANRHNAGYDPELDLLAIMNRHFQILNVNGEVAKAAGRLRGSYILGDKIALKTPDALIGATSLTNGHTLFVTNDAQLADALPDTNCIYLRDVALEWLAQNFPCPCFDDAGPVSPSKGGKGLPIGISAAWLELGGVQPNPSAKWRRILKDAQGDIRAAFKAGGAEEARAKAKELRAANRIKIRSLLNEEQKKKYDQIGQRPESVQGPAPAYKVRVPVPESRPVPVDITAGISDGSYTEVASGDLKEGQEVIVEAATGNNKGGSSSPAPQPSMKGFR